MGGGAEWAEDAVDLPEDRMPPPDGASDLDWIFYYQHRVLTRAQAMASMSRARLRHLVGTGQWRRTKAGVFVAHNGPLTRSQQLWAAVLGCGPRAVLGGLTAAHADGLRHEPGPQIHLLIPAEARRVSPGPAAGMPPIVVHRTSIFPDKDVDSRAHPPRTRMARSLVDAAQWARTDDAARVAVTAACRQRLTSAPEILDVLGRMPRARRRGVVLEAIGYTSHGAEAVSEIDFDKLCRAFGLPLPDRQVPRIDRGGRQRYLDAYWGAFRIQAEVDGGYHLEPASYWADMFRQNALWIEGEKVLRFPAWAITRRPAEVAAQLRDALLQSGWHP